METNNLKIEQAILATLAYHDILNMPLTATEIWRYLFREQPIRDRPCIQGRSLIGASLTETENILKNLYKFNEIEFHSGYYYFLERQDLVEKRLKMHALAQIKWKRLRRIVWFLQAIPFLEMVAASGSLAREFTHKDSDLDVLLVTKAGRIWTVRFIVTVILDLFHLRRRPTGPTRDLVCLNHYLAQDGLALPYQSLYTALEYAHIVPLIGDKVCAEFREANREWIEKYLVRLLPDEIDNLKQVRKSFFLSGIKKIVELLLCGMVGDALEEWLGKRQKERIVKNEENATAGGRIVASPLHLEFHPHSKEAPLLKKFNEKMAEMGLDAFGGQKDSGLTKNANGYMIPTSSDADPP
ncbi:MAG: nucleotidyltransferase domain-containing protein [bacterium]|nr:nucleotidyltransferase domain-containing protein [bacterium]